MNNQFKKIKYQDKDIKNIVYGAYIERQPRINVANMKTSSVIESIACSTELLKEPDKNIKENAFDGDRLGNRWISNEDDSNPFISIGFKKVITVDEIRIYTGWQKGTSSFITNLKILADNNLIIEDKIARKYELIYKVNIEASKFTFRFPAGLNRVYQIEIYGEYYKDKGRIMWP